MEGLTRSQTQPTLFRFRIESFSLLSTSSSTKRFESCEFDAKGYKWKLVIYANGSEKGGGKDHLSLYLALADNSCLDENEELLVSFSLLVFDHIQDNYLKVQAVSRLNAMKSESGFDKFLPLKIFNDPSNGYLKDETCMFGAEVVSVVSTNKKQFLFENKMEHLPVKHTWKIEKFSELKDEFYWSEKFTVKGLDFKVLLYPKGHRSGAGTSLSLYFAMADPHKLPSGMKVHVNFTLRIINQVNKKYTKQASDQNNFSLEDFSGWGFHEFLSLKKLDMSTGFLVNDTCVFEVDVTECELGNDWV